MSNIENNNTEKTQVNFLDENSSTLFLDNLASQNSIRGIKKKVLKKNLSKPQVRDLSSDSADDQIKANSTFETVKPQHPFTNVEAMN